MAGPSRRQLRAAMRTGVSDLSFQGRGEVQLRTLWGKLDEGDGSQLLAELFKYYHALKEGLVVQPERYSMEGGTDGTGQPCA